MLKAPVLWLFTLVLTLSTPLQQFSSVSVQPEVPVVVHHGVHLVELQILLEEDAHSEYVVLYSQTDEPIVLSDWRLEYKPGTSGNWSDKSLSTQPADVDFVISPSGFFTEPGR